MWLARCYMVVVSALLGWSLTKLPEWTTWAVLIALAFWDVLAVGCASGPLRRWSTSRRSAARRSRG